MIKSALQSSLTNDVKYSSMSAGAVPSSEYLISTTILSQTTPNVTFDVSGLGSQFRHLKLVYSARTDRSGIGTTADLRIRFNGDTGSNYNAHVLGGDGSSVVSSYYSSTTINYIGVWWIEGPLSAANSFGAGSVDILDAFNTNKNTTVRSLAGNSGRVAMTSGAWTNTAALTSIELAPNTSGSFVQYSRLSLYGVTA
jgi:hypothetical protein